MSAQTQTVRSPVGGRKTLGLNIRPCDDLGEYAFRSLKQRSPQKSLRTTTSGVNISNRSSPEDEKSSHADIIHLQIASPRRVVQLARLQMQFGNRNTGPYIPTLLRLLVDTRWLHGRMEKILVLSNRAGFGRDGGFYVNVIRLVSRAQATHRAR